MLRNTETELFQQEKYLDTKVLVAGILAPKLQKIPSSQGYSTKYAPISGLRGSWKLIFNEPVVLSSTSKPVNMSSKHLLSLEILRAHFFANLGSHFLKIRKLDIIEC